MMAGEMYNPVDEEIQTDLLATGAWLKRYNDNLGSTAEHWNAILLERLGEVGTGAV
ncbi:maltose acetyltransferase domain-containing protein, partial [Rhizobium ruizarguesonis]